MVALLESTMEEVEQDDKSEMELSKLLYQTYGDKVFTGLDAELPSIKEYLNDNEMDKPMYTNFMEKLSCRSFVNPQYIVYLMSSLYSVGVVWPYIKAITGIQDLDITSLLNL